MHSSKTRFSMTGKMTAGGANIAGVLIATGIAVFLVLSGAALVIAAN